jgi:hypothetical protein
MPNQITTLRPYRWNGMWVFDDERVGLHREPFVGGADDIIDAAIAEKGIVNADAGFLLLFSADPFPGADLEFTWVRGEKTHGGNTYFWEGHGMEGWLCPALLKYFPEAPPKIYVQARAIR